jgi:N-acetylglucosamine kinase-like BadF-type ATPase
MVLGVDGGGSKTHLALASPEGRLQAMESGPGTNLESQKPAAIAGILSGMLARACRKAHIRPRDIQASCFGLCGVDIREDVGQARRIIAGPLGLGRSASFHNDAFIALFNDGWRPGGAVVTVGSGHKWLAVRGGKEFMHDGLVFQGLKDKAMEELLKAAEGYTAPSGFTRRMYRRFGFRSPADFLRRWRYGGSRKYVRPIPARSWKCMSRIQELLGRDAAAGDPLALAILDRYAFSLAEGTEVAARAVGAPGRGLEVVLSGSVLAGIKPLRDAFRRHLKRLVPGASAVPARFRPVRGALVYAAHQAWGGLPAASLREKALCYR